MAPAAPFPPPYPGTVPESPTGLGSPATELLSRRAVPRELWLSKAGHLTSDRWFGLVIRISHSREPGP